MGNNQNAGDNENQSDNQNQSDDLPFEPVTESATISGIEDMLPVEGSTGSIVRYEDRVEMSIEAVGYEAGEVLTLWISVDNTPDSEDPMDGFSALNPVGAVADEMGVALFSKVFQVDDMADVAFGPGLTDSINAEFFLIVRTHGIQIEDELEAQLNSFDGGCPPNECADIQVVEFAKTG
jgi:hypothetical protein